MDTPDDYFLSESHRRAVLHAQIAALKERFLVLSKPAYAIDWLKRLKLAKKIQRLERELDEPTLFGVVGKGGEPVRKLPN